MKGTLRWEQLDSPALKSNPLSDPFVRPLLVYLPPSYAEGRRSYPVVYFLHGFGGGARQWKNFSGFSPTVPERLDSLIVQGSIPEVVGVFLDGWTSLGGTQWDNSDAVGQYRDYVAQDVVGFIDRTFQTIPKAESRAVVGKSSGGYGSMVMGRHHPDVFAHIGCHSGDAYFEYCYVPDFPKAAGALLKAGGIQAWYRLFLRTAKETKVRHDDMAVINVVAMAAAYSPRSGEPLGIELPFEIETGRIRPEVWLRWQERDPVRFIARDSIPFKRLRSIFVDCGVKDEFNLRWGARMVVKALRRSGIEVVHEEFDDGHLGINYRYDRSLLHLAPRMSRV